MIAILGLAIPFALVSMALSNQLNWEGFIFGYLVSVIVLRIGQASNLKFNPARAPLQFAYLLYYCVRLTWDIFISSIQVVGIVFTRDIDKALDSGVLKISTQDKTNNEIVTAMSSHGITITPGQLVLDITEENGETIMHVHNLQVNQSRPTIENEQTQRLKLIQRILGYDS